MSQGISHLSEAAKANEGGSGQEASLERLIRQVAKGGVTSLAGRTFRRVVNVLFQILLTRVLSVSAYGLYALGYSVLGMVHRVSMLGLQNAAVRFGAMYHGKGDKSRLKGTFLAVLFISTCSAIIVAILLFFLSDFTAHYLFNKPQFAAVLKVFAFALPFYVLMAVSAALARGLKNIKCSTGISDVFQPVSNLFIVGIAFLLGFRLVGAVYGFVISSAFAAGLGGYLLWRIFLPLISDIEPRYEWRKILNYSLTVFLVGFSYMLLSNIDRIMLGYLATSGNVGVYNAAALLAAQLPIFLLSLNAIFSPVIAELYSQDRMHQLESLLKTVAKWTFTLTLPMFIVMLLFPKEIMSVFGERFVNAWLVLIVLATGQLLHAGLGSMEFVLTMTGRQKTELFNGIALVALNILLNIFLIPKHGILGAAIATGVSIVLLNLVRLVEVYLFFKMHPYKSSSWKPIVAGFIGGGLWLGLSSVIPFRGWAWIGGAVIFLALYLGVLWLLGFDEEDKIVLQALKKRLLQR